MIMMIKINDSIPLVLLLLIFILTWVQRKLLMRLQICTIVHNGL